MPHHVSLSPIIVSGSSACALFLTIASSLARVALGACEIVDASPPGGKIAPGVGLTLHVAHVGALSVINASAPPPDVMATDTGSILALLRSILSTAGACAFLPSRSPFRTFQADEVRSASVTRPFIVSNADGYSIACYILCFAIIALSLGQNKKQKQKQKQEIGGILILRVGQRSSSFSRIKRLCKHFETLKHTFLFVVSVTYLSLVLHRSRSSSLVQKMKRNQKWMAHVLFWSVISSLSLVVHGTQIVSDPQIILV